MIFPTNPVLTVVDWIANRLGLDLDLADDGVIDSLDEQEVAEQLQYGRD